MEIREYLDYGHTGMLEYNKVNNHVKSKLYHTVDFTTMAKLNQIHLSSWFLCLWKRKLNFCKSKI